MAILSGIGVGYGKLGAGHTKPAIFQSENYY